MLSQVNSPWLQGVVMVISLYATLPGWTRSTAPTLVRFTFLGYRPFSGHIRRPVSDRLECQVHRLWGLCESQLWPTSYHWAGSLGDLWIPTPFACRSREFPKQLLIVPAPTASFSIQLCGHVKRRMDYTPMALPREKKRMSPHQHVGFPKQIMIWVQEPICEPIVSHSCRPNCIF
jgi:hypothetical protein